MLPKSVIQMKFKQLEDNEVLLKTKEGDREFEGKLGVKLQNRYQTIQHHDDPLPGEEVPKEKTYFEKKKERLESEGRNLEEVNELLIKIKEEKKARKDKKRKEKAE